MERCPRPLEPTLALPAFQLLSVGLKQEATPLRHQHKWEWPETLGDGYRQAFLTQQCAMLGPADLTVLVVQTCQL